MTGGPQSDYDTRDVDYSLIHGETREVLSQFVKVLQLKEDSKVLDVGGGYGSILVSILENEPGLCFHYDLLDSSEGQIKKAKKHIDNFLAKNASSSTIRYFHQNADKMDLSADFYDVVVCKMFIHELPLPKQEALFKNIFSVLKPGGQLVIWTPDLDEGDHHFYTETIRIKDELAGFHNLVKNRHFLLNSELFSFLENAGFSGIEKLFDFHYNLHTSLRLKSEFHGKAETLKAWNTHILQIAECLSPELKQSLLVEVKNDNIHIRFKRAVFKGLKRE